MTARVPLLIAGVLVLVAGSLFAGAETEEGSSSPAAAAPAGKYQEAPMLAALVAAGELPPVDERLPEIPSVADLVPEVGRYGGTLNVFSVDERPWNDLTAESVDNGSSNLLQFTPDGRIIPDLALSYELADDAKSMTLALRKGTRWSDGEPFTADDILFVFEDMHWHPEVETWAILSGVSRVIKIDDYNVRYEMDEPYPVLEVQLGAWPGSQWASFHPKHYLKKWHINHNPDANKVAKEEGFEDWTRAFHYHFWWRPKKDIEQPTMMPWRFTSFTTTVRTYERNPYYFQVDAEGKQLPYIDTIVSTLVDRETYQLKAISGEADIAFRRTSVDNWSLYKQNESAGGYVVYGAPGVLSADVGLALNQNHEDPDLRALFQDIRFRRALSVAIDRDDLNKSVYLGLGTPLQATMLPSTTFYKEEWGQAHAEYDPDEANRLLDEVGLSERDRDGFRIGPDGDALLITVEWSATLSVPPAAFELIKEYWEDVGVKVGLRPMENALFSERGTGTDHAFRARKMETVEEVAFYLEPNRAEVGGLGFSWAPTWELWLHAKADVDSGKKTLADFADGKLPGEEPPQEMKDLQRWVDEVSTTRFGSPEFVALAQQIWDLHAKNLYIIGTVGLQPVPVLAKENLGNVRTTFPMAADYSGNLGADAQHLFWRE